MSARRLLFLVTARRPGGPGFSPHNHLSGGNTSAALTLCGLQVRSPINHLAPAITLADCQNCQRSLKAQAAASCDCHGSYTNGTSHTDRCLTRQWTARAAN